MDSPAPTGITYSSEITQEDFDTINHWSLIVNYMSLVGAVLVVSVVLGSSLMGSVASKRLSFRMSMWIALSDVLFCLFSFFNVDNNPTLCPIFTAITYFCNLLYVFLTTSITFNLHLTLLCGNSSWGYRMRKLFLKETVLLVGSILMALAITLPPLAISLSKGGCVLFHLVEGPGAKVAMLWATVGLWESICFLYTTVVVVFVVHTLHNHSRMLTANAASRASRQHSIAVVDDDPNGIVKCRARPSLQEHNDSRLRNRRGSASTTPVLGSRFDRVARRILFYPLIPLVTQSFYIAINSYFLYIGQRTLVLLYLFYLVPYSAGLLNALVFFLFDPSIPEITSELKARFCSSPTFLPHGLPDIPEQSQPAWCQEPTTRQAKVPE